MGRPETKAAGVDRVLYDDVAEYLSIKAGEGFFRAFIVEDRESGEVSCNFRFRYKDGDSWYRLKPQKGMSRAEAVADFQEGMEKVLLVALSKAGWDAARPGELIRSIFIPDFGGDAEKTIQWLLKEDLMVISKIEEE